MHQKNEPSWFGVDYPTWTVTSNCLVMQSKLSRFVVRTIPKIGTLVLSAITVAYLWNYMQIKTQLKKQRTSIDEPMIVEFYKQVEKESSGWKNKRVPRSWEESDEK
ncbi:hypothetical protein T265_10901 [Opisthorchis viverrini]|uniref:Cytochrome c oxidase assembly protein COX16 homolog, mitochondrial n=1 Tax=Opisthorchis viverrini TaxID=6198 RepID=A0A074ZBI3_OPIVI|nr:hypothetical protein T265_10901 [Opisthorchis viverrini]KER20580.1 hypothetical protein T265_10901 [Opisthorchis viverrini]